MSALPHYDYQPPSLPRPALALAPVPPVEALARVEAFFQRWEQFACDLGAEQAQKSAYLAVEGEVQAALDVVEMLSLASQHGAWAPGEATTRQLRLLRTQAITLVKKIRWILAAPEHQASLAQAGVALWQEHAAAFSEEERAHLRDVAENEPPTPPRDAP